MQEARAGKFILQISAIKRKSAAPCLYLSLSSTADAESKADKNAFIHAEPFPEKQVTIQYSRMAVARSSPSV